MRSALTALGVIIGVASVVAMVSLGAGAQAQVERSIASLGSNLLIVVLGAPRGQGGVRGQAGGGGGWDSLTLDDAEAIATQVEGVMVVAPSQRSRAQVKPSPMGARAPTGSTASRLASVKEKGSVSRRAVL